MLKVIVSGGRKCKFDPDQGSVDFFFEVEINPLNFRTTFVLDTLFWTTFSDWNQALSFSLESVYITSRYGMTSDKRTFQSRQSHSSLHGPKDRFF